MKSILDSESRKAIIDYRLEKSRDAILDAEILAQNQRFDNAVTRLYYACYYVASALLIANGIETTTHAGIKRMLSLHFIKTGKLDCLYIRIYSDLMNGRQLSDYEDFVYQDFDSYSKYYQQTQEFIEKITNLLKNQ